MPWVPNLSDTSKIHKAGHLEHNAYPAAYGRYQISNSVTDSNYLPYLLG